MLICFHFLIDPRAPTDFRVVSNPVSPLKTLSWSFQDDSEMDAVVVYICYKTTLTDCVYEKTITVAGGKVPSNFTLQTHLKPATYVAYAISQSGGLNSSKTNMAEFQSGMLITVQGHLCLYLTDC